MSEFNKEKDLYEHECEGSKREEVQIFRIDIGYTWSIKINEPSYRCCDFLENIEYCPWCGAKLQ